MTVLIYLSTNALAYILILPLYHPSTQPLVRTVEIIGANIVDTDKSCYYENVRANLRDFRIKICQ